MAKKFLDPATPHRDAKRVTSAVGDCDAFFAVIYIYIYVYKALYVSSGFEGGFCVEDAGTGASYFGGFSLYLTIRIPLRVHYFITVYGSTRQSGSNE